jgi:hypothetical protein
MVSACKSQTCAAGFDKVEFVYDGEGNRTQIKTTTAAGAVATRDFRYQDDAIVEELLTDATHSNAVVRSYVVDESGTVVKLTVAAGEPDAGHYVPIWNGHGDAVNLSRLNADGTLTQFRLLNTPFYAKGLSVDDVIAATLAPDGYEFDSVIERSGHSTYRLIPEDRDQVAQGLMDLQRLRCTWEEGPGGLLAIDVPPESNIHDVYAVLESGSEQGIWDFEEGHVGHGILERHLP